MVAPESGPVRASQGCCQAVSNHKTRRCDQGIIADPTVRRFNSHSLCEDGGNVVFSSGSSNP